MLPSDVVPFVPWEAQIYPSCPTDIADVIQVAFHFLILCLFAWPASFCCVASFLRWISSSILDKGHRRFAKRVSSCRFHCLSCSFTLHFQINRGLYEGEFKTELLKGADVICSTLNFCASPQLEKIKFSRDRPFTCCIVDEVIFFFFMKLLCCSFCVVRTQLCDILLSFCDRPHFAGVAVHGSRLPNSFGICRDEIDAGWGSETVAAHCDIGREYTSIRIKVAILSKTERFFVIYVRPFCYFRELQITILASRCLTDSASSSMKIPEAAARYTSWTRNTECIRILSNSRTNTSTTTDCALIRE